MKAISNIIKRVFTLFSSRRTWVRQIAIAGLAGALAWELGDVLISNGGLVAAIVCTLSIRISLHKSLREGLGIALIVAGVLWLLSGT